jgi:hypothetical protein
MTNKEFLKIMFFVHPDRHKDETERRNKATRILLRYRDMMVRKRNAKSLRTSTSQPVATWMR